MDTVVLNKEGREIIIIDQTGLPSKLEYLHLKTQNEIYDAIYKLKVRGAPAIGVTGAFGMYLAALDINKENTEEFYKEFLKNKEYIASSRPTARNLFWGLERMEKCVLDNLKSKIHIIKEKLYEEAVSIQREDIDSCYKIGEYGLELLKQGDGILTHCNAGALATSKYGTATAPIYLGHERGYGFKVFADETRPLLQGARLTAYELMRAGIDVTLICDNMISSVMEKGWINAVFTGCDCVAANGDIANKIGTSVVSIVAKRYNIPFYVCVPTSTFDMTKPTGKDIIIEERPAEEVSHMWYKEPMTPANVKIYNPAFDITKREYITAIITEKGILT